ncbi:DUF2968 domain-containing protein [Bordetella pseudohinzii]|uniref:Protein of uncharacterized function (DUF2968) n=1 Tax=Bordetella pseudohinzii TaxID=1331258 RepID=A0A0J6BZZ1_9BORD|nr:DUF2968 domain-containing protein [Bordetella pseudohinzii]ANY15268.1 hypothetical protein BBN53_04795 [Bordetella pseudohinzii]KMM24343.1 lipoprotein [Bordetella pseudohinzii]KXA75648.1 hypothetical protein AW877_19385 [Bordetella pseudohinzii]KXA76061.1 hypothetical protein AW878_18970 [Bordetella pseudohinzii]CUI49063.1 Protein of uncharacterised function (DUF2968) [Bordetella pseudohinzii]
MKIDILGKGARLAMAGTILSALAACATTQPEAERPVVQQVENKDAATTPVTPPPPPAPAPRAGSTATELQGLIQSRQVSELRTAYNGSYGASLLFKPDDQTYFVALFQQKDFWRVVKTQSSAQAEATYRSFVTRSAELADIEIRRIRLQAEYNKAEQQLAARNAELAALQADQALRQEQEQQVAARQAQSRQEAQALNDQNKDVREQLRKLQRQIDSLQAEQMRLNAPRRK